jgi:hypothetical protein
MVVFCICSMMWLLPALLIVYLVKFPKYKEWEGENSNFVDIIILFCI